MNDPQVVSLTYQVLKSEHVTYDNPPPVEFESGAFAARLEGQTLLVTMRDHFATEAEARAVVDPFLRSWEIDAGLRRNCLAITFDFAHSRIIDRNPSQGGLLEPLKLYARAKAGIALAEAVVSQVYPAPPQGFAATPDVQTMWFRYQMYLDGKEPLLSMAYACLTLLEGTTGLKHGARKSVCAMYSIDQSIRDKLGDLVSQKGAPEEARKLDYEATRVPLTGQERQWVEDVIKALIRRKAEYDADPTAPLNQITMADFVTL
jgi:hypothetical protein